LFPQQTTATSSQSVLEAIFEIEICHDQTEKRRGKNLCDDVVVRLPVEQIQQEFHTLVTPITSRTVPETARSIADSFQTHEILCRSRPRVRRLDRLCYHSEHRTQEIRSYRGAMARPKIAIVGGGFGGVFTALELSGAGDITLVSDQDHFLFKPMLYEYLSGEVEAWHIAPDYAELFDDRTSVIVSAVTDIDFSARSILLADKRRLPYDILVLAPGAITNYAGIAGAEEFALPFRSLTDADHLRQRMVEALDRTAPDLPPQDVRNALTFAIVGGGASGVELSTKMADLLNDAFRRRSLKGEPRVLVIEMSDRVVPGMGDEIRSFVEGALRQSRVETYTVTRVVRVTADTVTLEHDDKQTVIPVAAVVWVGGVQVNPLIRRLDLEKTSRGLILVEPTLQTRSHKNVIALGDIAFFPDAVPTLAGTAQLALQQAGLAAKNVRALLSGGELHTKHFEELGEAVSLGTERAAVLAGGKAFGGALARQARFAMYTGRLPTWHHRLRVGASWFFEGTQPRPLLPLGFTR
jgi:demethylphylloquinone reductase